MQIVGQIVKGSIVIIDMYGKEQTLGKGQTILLGDTIKAKSDNAYVLFDVNPEPVPVSSDAMEIDDDFLAYLASEAQKAQEGTVAGITDELQDQEIQELVETDEETPEQSSTLFSNTSINSIDLFDTHIQPISLLHNFEEKQIVQESNLQFSLVGDNGQYYLRGSDTEKLIVFAHARNGTLSDADNDRHFEVLGVSRGNIPVNEINIVLQATHLPLQETEDVPAVVQDVVDTLTTWHQGAFLDAHDMVVLGIDYSGIDVANINEALDNTHFYDTGTLAAFYPVTQNIIQTLHALAENSTINNEQLQTLGVLSSSQALSEGELEYLANNLQVTPDTGNFMTELTSLSEILYTSAMAPTRVDLTEDSDSGVSQEDNKTNDTTPSFMIDLPGDVSTGDIITIHDGSDVLQNHTITEAEARSHTVVITINTPLIDGAHSISATITDSHDNTSPAQISTLTVDTTADTESDLAIALSSASDDNDVNSINDDQAVDGDNQTNDTTPTLDLSGIDSDAVEVRVQIGEQSYTLSRNSADEAWVADDNFIVDSSTNTVIGLTSEALTDGTYNIGVQVIDDAGNQTDLVSGASVTVDTQVSPVITTHADKSNHYTFDLSDALQTEQAAAGLQSLLIQDEEGNTIATYTYSDTLNSEGSHWTAAVAENYSIDGTIEDGIDIFIINNGERNYYSDNITVTTYDAAGNSTQATTFVPTPTIELVHDNGTSQSDYITNDGHINITLGSSTQHPFPLGDAYGWQYSTDGGETWIDGSGNAFELPEGNYAQDQLLVRQTHGDNHSTAVSLGHDLVVDTTADTITLSLAEDTANPNDPATQSDAITSDTTVIIDGLENTSTFEYSLDGGANWITGTGSSFELAENTTYADGDVLVRTTDIAGNVSTPVSVGAVTTDNTADTVTLSLAEDTGRDDNDGITQDTTVNVTGLESSSTWQYSTDYGNTWIAGSGTSFELEENTSYNAGQIQVRTTDIAGNETAISMGEVTTDNIAPTNAPTITLIGGNEDNSNENDLIVSDTTPTILGSAEAGSTVSITYTDALGNTYTDTAIASSTGEYSITLSHALEENSETSLTLMSTDTAGNVSPSITQNITIDTSADNDNIPFALILEDSDLDGVNAEEAANIVLGLQGIDSDAVSVKVVFSDNNDATEDVVVYASQAADGTWSIADADISGLTNGDISVTATVTDIAGNVATDTHTIVLNRDIPDAPTVEIIEDDNNDGILVNDEILNEDLDVNIEIPDQTPENGILTVTTTGRTLSAENTLHLAINDNFGSNDYLEITTDTTSIRDGEYNWNVDFSIDASGTWTLILTTDISSSAGETLRFEYGEIPEEGDTFTVRAAITDSFGNSSTLSMDSVTRADETAPDAPIVTITEDTNNDGFISDSELSGQVDVKITLPTGVVAGDTLNITNPDNTVSHITITETMINNGYTTAYDAPAEGETITISATVTDASGNTSTSASDSITVDTSADTEGDLAIALSSASDDNDVNGINNTQAVDGDNQTNDTTPTLDLSGIDSDAVEVRVQIGDQSYTLARASADDAWATNDANFIVEDNTVIGLTSNAITTDGTYNIGVQVIDDAGNQTDLVSGASITVDTTADENNDLSISLTDADTLLLSGIDSDIQSIVINDGDNQIATITYDTANNEWSSDQGTYDTNTGTFALNTELSDGDHTLEITVTDDAGNTATSPGYTAYLGTTDNDTLTVSSTNQYASIDLGAGTDTLIISDSVTIDLSNVSNVETFNIGTDASLVGSGTDGALTLEDLGLTGSGDIITLSDVNDAQDNGTIKIDKSAFTDTDNDGTPNRTETDSDSDGTIDYYSYTTSDGEHTIQIDATIDVSWQ